MTHDYLVLSDEAEKHNEVSDSDFRAIQDQFFVQTRLSSIWKIVVGVTREAGRRADCCIVGGVGGVAHFTETPILSYQIRAHTELVGVKI